MSEETKSTVPALPTLEVTRNEVTVKYVSATKKRGATPGELFYQADPALKLEVFAVLFEDLKTSQHRNILLDQCWVEYDGQDVIDRLRTNTNRLLYD